MDQAKKSIELVLLDDNFVVRYVLRTLLHKLSGEIGLRLNIHTSEDGVQGLGYIFAVRPDVVIVDTTLPKYSGRELLEFLASNERYASGQHRVIVLHDGRLKLELPAKYVAVDKRSKFFLKILFGAVQNALQVEGTLQSRFLVKGWLWRVAGLVLRMANTSDLFLYKSSQSLLFIKLWWWIIASLSQIVQGIILSIIRLTNRDIPDTNVDQRNRDIWQFRTRYYPTLVTVVAAIFLLLIQFLAYVIGGVLIFDLAEKNVPVDAAFGNNYTYRRSVTINYSQVVGTANLTNFPVLISGTYSYLATTANGGNVTNANGYDIIFTSDAAGSTKLDHEIEKYTASTGEIVMWVEVPSVSYTTNTTIYMFYGNSSISSTQENENGVWDSNFRMVHHLEEGTTGNTSIIDSTSNGNSSDEVVIDGTGSNASATGKIGNAVQFDGSNDRIRVDDESSLDIAGSFTISAWINADSLPANLRIRSVVAKTGSITSDAAGTQANYALALNQGLSGSGHWWISSFENTSHTDYEVTNSFTSSTATWYHMVAAFNDSANTYTLYRNGSQVNQDTETGTPAANNKNLYIAVDNTAELSAYSEYFDGIIDEVRISNTERTAGWVGTEYNNQNTPSSFYSIGTEEIQVDVNVAAQGTQEASVLVGTNRYVGGSFAISAANNRTVTSITIRENGSIDATNNIKYIDMRYRMDTTAPYDCAGMSFSSGDPLFGSTDNDGFSGADGTATFNGSVNISATSTMCVFVSFDVQATTTGDEVIEIQIDNPSTDVVISSGTIGPNSTAAIPGSTVALRYNSLAAVGTQATNMYMGTNANYVGASYAIISNTGTRYIHGITVTEEGTIDAAADITNVRIYYENDTTAPYDCASESYAGTESSYGATSNTFSGANGTATFTSSVLLTTTSSMCFYVVVSTDGTIVPGSTLEIDIPNPDTDIDLTSATIGPTTGVALPGTTTLQSYFTVAAVGTQTVTATSPVSNFYMGGAITVSSEYSGAITYEVSKITLREQGTVDGQSSLDNIKVYYELDSSAPYDCASETYAGTETQYGSTDTDGFSAADGIAEFYGAVTITNTSTLCAYVVLDVGSGAANGETIEIDTGTTYSDVRVGDLMASIYYTQPVTAVVIAGTTTISAATTVTVSAYGSQTANISANTTGQYYGGAFVITSTGSSSVTSIKVAEQGTIDADVNIYNLRLYYDLDTTAPYDCAGESYGSESIYGSTTVTKGFDAVNGSATVSGSVTVNATQTMCVYVVSSFRIFAANGETVEVQITNPSTDVTVSSGTVSTTSNIAISGTTTIQNSSTVVNLQVGATADNGYDYASGTDLYTTNPLKLGGKLSTGSLITAGLRFLNVNVPRAAYIDSAMLDFNESYGGSYNTDVKSKIYAQASDSSDAFSSPSSLPRHKSVTSNSVDWDSNGALVATGEWYMDSQSAPPPEIATVIKEVIDRTGWSSGNNLSVIIKDDGSTNDWWMEPRAYAYGASYAPKLRIAYRTTSVTVSASGSQASTVDAGDTNQYLGGTFVIHPATVPATITGITISEQGTVDAQNGLDNIKLFYELDSSAPYDCASETYVGTESQFGSTDTDGFSSSNGTSSFTGNLAVTTTQAMCAYVVLDVASGAGNGNTIEIQVTDPSTQVTVASGSVSPATVVALSGTTTIAGNVSPTLSNVSLNGGTDISLIESSTVSVSITGTVTDENGWGDISAATGTIYRSGVAGGSACNPDNNNCYVVATCQLSGCSGNSCTATCTASMQFHSDPTDEDSPYSGQYWLGWIQATDSQSATGSGTSPTDLTDVGTLLALNAESNIDYAQLLAGEDSGADNEYTVVYNTGNAVIDFEIAGENLCADPPTCSQIITVNNQQYGLGSFTFGNGSTLTLSPNQVNVSLAKPTDSPSNSSATIFWGIGIPLQTSAGEYSGSNSIVAILD